MVLTRAIGPLASIFSTPARRVAAATSYAQLILIAITPFLTRFYNQDVFGSYQVAFSIALVLQLVFSAGTEYLIPAQPSAYAQSKLVRRGFVALLSGATLCALISLVSLFFLNFNVASIAISATAMGVVMATSNIDNARLLARDEVPVLVARNILAGTVGAGLQTVGGVSSPSLLTLTASLLIGRVLSLCIRAKSAKGGYDVAQKGQVETRLTSQALAWIISIVLSNAALQFPVMIGSLFYRLGEIAQLALAIRIVGASASLLGMGLSLGLSYKVGQMLREGRPSVGDYVVKQQRKLAILSVWAGLVVSVSGPILVPVLLGTGYSLAGLLVGILGIPFSLQLVNRTMSPVFPIANANFHLLLLQILRAVGVCGSVLVSVTVLGASLTMLCTILAAFMLLFYLYFFVLTRRVLRDRLNQMSTV